MSIIEFLRLSRFFGYAIFDLLLSFLGIYLLSPLLSKIFLKLGVTIPKRNWLYLTLPIGILAHLAFGKMTPMTVNFLDIYGHYILKIIIIVLLIIGLRDIKTSWSKNKK